MVGMVPWSKFHPGAKIKQHRCWNTLPLKAPVFRILLLQLIKNILTYEWVARYISLQIDGLGRT